ncbi:MAG: hypothetical protein Ct9H90mP27_7580 [Gammaproteobacteria bacterium]|nr:MAG: hypothetical protein Ct9H90mP27_7580 [Gammaproteobacteria bacterium]
MIGDLLQMIIGVVQIISVPFLVSVLFFRARESLEKADVIISNQICYFQTWLWAEGLFCRACFLYLYH